MDQKPFYTPAQVAEALGISPRQVQLWCKAGQLAAYRVGKAYRIPPDAFAALVKQQPAGPRHIDVGQTFEVELSSLVQGWLWDMEHGPKPRSPETVRTHRMHLHKYVKLLLGRDVPPDYKVGYQDVISEASMLKVLGLIPVARYASRHNVYMAVVSLCNFLVRQGVLDPGVKAAIKVHKPTRLFPPKRTSLATEADVNRYIQTVWLTEEYTLYEKTLNTALIGTMAFAGLRVSEVVRLELGDLELGARLLHVRNGKGGKARVVGINLRLKGVIEEYLKLRPGSTCLRLFLAAKGTGLTRDAIVKRLGRLQKRTGLPISAHSLRRTFATLNANAGRSLNLIQLALGHADLSTTQKYLMADQNTAARAMQDW